MTNEEIREELLLKTTVSKKPFKGTSMGFRRQYLFESGTIRCEINTNYSDALGGLYKKGFGKVVVKDSRTKHRLFSFDVRLGEEFLKTLCRYARAYVDFIVNWPYAASGEHRLLLEPIKGVMYEKYFVINKANQEGIYFLDIAMEEKNKKFLEKMLKRRSDLTGWEEKKGVYRKPLPVIRKEKNILRSSNKPDQTDSVKVE
jgi:hypothetical protein